MGSEMCIRDRTYTKLPLKNEQTSPRFFGVLLKMHLVSRKERGGPVGNRTTFCSISPFNISFEPRGVDPAPDSFAFGVRRARIIKRMYFPYPQRKPPVRKTGKMLGNDWTFRFSTTWIHVVRNSRAQTLLYKHIRSRVRVRGIGEMIARAMMCSCYVPMPCAHAI